MSPPLHLLAHLCRLSHSHKTSPPRNEHNEGSKIHSCFAKTLVQLETLPSEIHPLPTVNPGTLPKSLADVIRCLEPFLPAGCELFGEGDLKVIGSHPINSGGFADIWAGEMNDGTAVAIKSPRCHSSSYNSLISPPVVADRSWSGVYAQPRYSQWKSQDRASHVRTPTSNMCSRSFRLMSLWVTADIPASQV